MRKEWRGRGPGSGRAVDWSADGRRIAIGRGHVLAALDARHFSLPAPFCGHESAVTALAFGPCDDLLATSGADGRGRVFGIASERSVPLEPDADINCGALAISADGKRAAAGGRTGLVRLLDLP